MPYPKTNWVDRDVQYPKKFNKTGETSSEVTLTPSPGTVTEQGTPLSSSNLNKIEQGIADATGTAESHAIRHATGGADELTPADIGAETPAGAQSKADTAETNAKNASVAKAGDNMKGPLSFGNRFQIQHNATQDSLDIKVI